jgi:hypothetical protein
MLGIPLRYLLQHPISGVAYLAADPRQALTIVYEYYSYARERHPRIADMNPITIGNTGFMIAWALHGRVI